MNKHLISIAIIFLLLNACKKDTPATITGTNPPSPVNPVSINPTSYIVEMITPASYSIDSFKIQYDDSGRIKSILSINKPGDKELRNYSVGMFTIDKYQSDTLLYHETFLLNNAYLIDSAYVPGDNITTGRSAAKWIYNVSNQLVEKKFYQFYPNGNYSLGIHNYSYDNNGLLVRDTDLVYVSTIIYEYGNNPIKKPMAGQYFPNNNYFPTKQITRYHGITSSVGIYTPTFDADNRLVTYKENINSNGALYNYNYTYRY